MGHNLLREKQDMHTMVVIAGLQASLRPIVGITVFCLTCHCGAAPANTEYSSNPKWQDEFSKAVVTVLDDPNTSKAESIKYLLSGLSLANSEAHQLRELIANSESTSSMEFALANRSAAAGTSVGVAVDWILGRREILDAYPNMYPAWYLSLRNRSQSIALAARVRQQDVAFLMDVYTSSSLEIDYIGSWFRVNGELQESWPAAALAFLHVSSKAGNVRWRAGAGISTKYFPLFAPCLVAIPQKLDGEREYLLSCWHEMLASTDEITMAGSVSMLARKWIDDADVQRLSLMTLERIGSSRHFADRFAENGIFIANDADRVRFANGVRAIIANTYSRVQILEAILSDKKWKER
jgi:hypothetical protein